VGPTVLVAEDHDDLRAIVVAILSAEFWVVGAVGDGEQLVHGAIILKPDVIVSDIRMPVKDGPTAREELRSQGIDRPFVFMTMFEPADISSLLATGDVAYVHKTDLFNELKPAIHAVLDGNSYLSKTFQKKLGKGAS
jgi:DNA-binding NarL/FixJ family response regulator